MLVTVLVEALLLAVTAAKPFWILPNSNNGSPIQFPTVNNNPYTPVEYYFPYQPQLQPVASGVSRETLEVSLEMNDHWRKNPDEQQNQDPSDDEQQHEEPEIPQQPTKPDVQTENNPDQPCRGDIPMPYSFQYETDTMSRKETADEKGLVQGTYSYIDGAGVNRTVNYKADANGFVATGDIHPHIPSGDTNPVQKETGESQVPQKPSISKGDTGNSWKPKEAGKGTKTTGGAKGSGSIKPLWGTRGISGWKNTK